MDDLSYRNIWISLGVGLTFVAIGMFVFRDSEEAAGIVAMLCFVLAIMLLQALDRRELRRKNGE
jgi:multidrug transporter EmrE-like cation transporter